MIYRISPDALEPRILNGLVYPVLERDIYWSDCWEPDFYVGLARAGFICISHHDPQLGALLMPEMQRSYAVLDWNDLHISRNVEKLMRSGRLEAEGVELRISEGGERVIEALQGYHARSWLTDPYRALLRAVPSGDDPAFSLCGVELWSRAHDRLVAGDLGYTIGRTYTSLSGFCTRDDPRWNHFGTLQMVLLAQHLRERGFAFWNLGHPSMRYKQALGARITPRAEFLARWFAAIDERPSRPLGLDFAP